MRPLAAAVRGLARVALPACLCALPPSIGVALDLGTLTIDSRLGQPFSAWLPVHADPDEPLGAACFSVPASAVGQSDLPTLTGVSLSLEARGGMSGLGIRTTRAVLEPALALVVRADCPGTHPVSREYTVLLNPPEAVLREAAAAAARATPRRTPRVETGRRPAPPESTPTPAPAAPVARPVGGPQQPPRRSSRPGDPPATSGYRSTTAARGDTLYGILSRLYPWMAPRERWQIVPAVVAANPGVFPRGNADRLPAGAELRVPDYPAPTSLSRDTRPPEPAPEPVAPSPAATRESTARLRILSSDEEEALPSSAPAAAPAATASQPPAPPVASPAPPPPAPETAASASTPKAPAAAGAPETPPSPGPAPAIAAGGGEALVADLRRRLADAEARVQALSSLNTQLRGQLGERGSLARLPSPSGPAEAAEGFGGYLPALLTLLAVPLAYVGARGLRRRVRTLRPGLRLPLPATRPSARATPDAAPPVFTTSSPPEARPAEPLAPAVQHDDARDRQALPTADEVVFLDTGPLPSATQDLRVEIEAAGHAVPLQMISAALATAQARDEDEDAAPSPEGGVPPLHRLLLEAELHLLFDQLSEARAVLEQAVAADSDQRPDLRPWTMLFDVLRLMGDREAFEGHSRQFKRRYNVSPPAWVRPAPASGDTSLGERFPHVLDRIIQLWGTQEGLELVNGLLLDDRGGSRQGFEYQIGEELSFLRDVLDRRLSDDARLEADGPDDERWTATASHIAVG
jgi:phage tail protein X